MRQFGLIGFPLAQSFSKKYFTEKFAQSGIEDAAYEAYELPAIADFQQLVENTPHLKGLNVTIPYKREVLPFLQEIDAEAKAIGACNCLKITNGIIKGYNTDAPAFKASLLTLLQPHHNKALVLGTGGAAQAVAFVLTQLDIPFTYVSRNGGDGKLAYEAINEAILQEHTLIVNTTPLGSFPKVAACAPIPYQYLTSQHYLYDLVYNPPVTAFLQHGIDKGAITQNGYDMLVGQAELSWKIWNEE